VIGPRQALRAWWLARLKPVDSWTLTQRSVYILPTRAGLAFALTLLLLLLASINFQLNLGYALTFLLTGSAVASMHMTHGSLRGLRLHVKPPPPAFVGGRVELDLVLSNPGLARHGLGFGVETGNDLAWVEVPAQEQTHVHLSFPAERRGRVALPLLRVESQFPFGLFRAWSVWRPAGMAWIYPAPEAGAPPLPPGTPTRTGASATTLAQGGEFEGLRPWRSGDGLRQVVWKKVARTGELVSREQCESAQQALWLDWSAAAATRDTERRLSRLCAWVLQADAQGLTYGLRLPGLRLPAAPGVIQKRLALEALAEWA
jgi:uncharacterized protein (DUF58 family)